MSSLARWSGRVAVVTGASSGIGASIALELCRNGLITVGLARRVEKIEALRSKLTPEQQRNFHAMKCDVSSEEEIMRTFDAIASQFGGVDVLVNNAGTESEASLTAANNSAEMRKVIDTNVLGVVFCTREAVKSMRARNVEGHVIHINSVLGHFMPYEEEFPTSIGIYYASKFAVTALAEQHRQEFIKERLNIKVTSLSPGTVLTEAVTESSFFPSKSDMEEYIRNNPFLATEDIANAVIYLLSTPPKVLITELTIRPMNETH